LRFPPPEGSGASSPIPGIKVCVHARILAVAAISRSLFSFAVCSFSASVFSFSFFAAFFSSFARTARAFSCSLA